MSAGSNRLDGSWLRLAAVAWAVAAGALLPIAPGAAAILAAIPVAAALGLVRPFYWALAAVAWALLGPTSIELGAVPGAAERLDLVLAWGALALALATRRSDDPLTRGLVLALLVLAALFVVSGAAGDSPVGAVVLGLCLLLAPIALICAILLDPPGDGERRFGLWVLLGLAFVQAPICFVQWLEAGPANPDAVKGTLVGTTMGHHAIGAICGAAAIWLVSRARRPVELLAVIPLLLAIFWTDSKQVVLALPIAAVLSPAATPITAALRVAIAGGAALALLLVPTLSSAYDYAGKQIEQVVAGDARKVAAAQRVGAELGSSPADLSLGLGSGNSVGFVALLADPLNDPEQRNETASALGLEPSELASRLASNAPLSEGSFGSQYSSLMGLLGDLGLAGALVYAGMLAAMIASLWRARGPEDSGAIAALVLMLVLGVVYIWWEYVPFTLYVAAFAALALARQRRGEASPAG